MGWYKEEEWTYNTDLEVEENAKDSSACRCQRTLSETSDHCKSRRNYFASHELPVYKKDGSKPFAVGSTNKNETVSEGDYTNMKNYLGTSVKDGSNFVDQIQKRSGDINMNGIYDVYDYAFTMFQLDGGTKQTGEVSGQARLCAEKACVKAGETVTFAVHVEDAKNVNAFGAVIDYDPSRLEFVSAAGTEAAGEMEDLTVNKVYNDGTAYVNLAFANRGDKPMYCGSDTLAVITMKALTDLCVAEEMKSDKILLIGPGYDVAGEEDAEEAKQDTEEQKASEEK